MSAAQAATALAASVETQEEGSGPENGVQRCVRKPSSTWSSCKCPDCVVRNARLNKLRRALHADP